jgi:hypothetical protein
MINLLAAMTRISLWENLRPIAMPIGSSGGRAPAVALDL